MAEFVNSRSASLLPMLAIEYSQRAGSVAVLPGSATGCVTTEHCTGDWHHEDILTPAIARALTACASSPRSIAVSIGPGGFTGIRMSVAAAKGLAMGLSVPVIPVPSAVVVAQSLRDRLRQIGATCVDVALSGKRGSFWLTRISLTDSGWSIDSQGLFTAESYSPGAAKAFVADEHIDQLASAKAAAAGLAVIAPVWTAEACGRAAMAAGAAVNARDLMPLYPREPEAVTVWQARKGG